MKRRVLQALFALAAAGIAIVAWRDAAVAYWLGTGDGDAPAWLHDDMLTLLDREKTFPASGIRSTDQAAEVAMLARSALRSAPLRPAALRDLALASERMGKPGSRKLLDISERISRRDLPAQNALLRLAADNGDYAGAVSHLDRMLLIEPDLLSRFLDGMTALAAEPEGRRVLSGYGDRPWFRDFIQKALERSQDPREAAALLTSAKGLHPDARNALSPALLARLIAMGDYGGARKFALDFAGATPATLDDFRPSRATTNASLAPLSWQLTANGETEVCFDPQQGIQAAVSSASITLMKRITLLPAGTYSFEQRLGPLMRGGDLRLEWFLTCGGKSQPSWRQQVPLASANVGYRSRVTIPVDCPAQRWRLAATTDGAQGQANFTITELSLYPRPAS